MRVSEERARDFGEVLTPSWMVDEMLAPVSGELGSFSRVLDLCCGPGAFIVRVLELRLKQLPVGHSGADVVACVSGLYGVELLEDNVETCLIRLVAVVCSHVSDFPDALDVVELCRTVLLKNLIRAEVSDLASVVFPVWNADLFAAALVGSVFVEDLFVGVFASAGFFDYIISNPPYQKNISGSSVESRLRNHSKATPVYHLFFDLARALEPKFLSFIMPAKWFTGGWGLNVWRASVISDGRVEQLHDYRYSSTVFPGTEVNGGVCWVLWNRDFAGVPRVVHYDKAGAVTGDAVRPLKVPGADFFVRDGKSVSILDKVGSFRLKEGERVSDSILGTTPFGFNSNYVGYSETKTAVKNVLLYYIKKKEFWVSMSDVKSNVDVVGQWKIFLSLSYNQHSPQIINTPVVYGPGSVCTHSYITFVDFGSEREALNCVSYMRTKFFRFLAHQLKISPIATKQVYRLIPVQDWGKPWSDEELYRKYGLSAEEQAHIERTISSM